MQPSKYKVLEELGAGGMGKVYKGVVIGQSGFQRPIVVKQLRQTDDAGHIRMFVDEARRYAVLDHENIGASSISRTSTASSASSSSTSTAGP
jgi:serine/threonine protein kinase